MTTRTITVELTHEQAEAAIYALRREAHRQDPGKYPEHDPAFPDYDPWPDDMAELADDLEVLLHPAPAGPGALESCDDR